MSKGKIWIGVAVVFSLAFLIYAASYESAPEPTPEPRNLAEVRVRAIDGYAESGKPVVIIDESGPEDVVDYMGRSPDNMTRTPSDYRGFHYTMGDGSAIVFYFKERHGGGLQLDHYRAE